jgi:hypothetical protein
MSEANMTPETLQQQNRNAELVRQSEPDCPPMFHDFKESDFVICPECGEYVEEIELKRDVVCWHCIRKGF